MVPNVVDVTDSAHLDACIAEVTEQHGSVHVLINNAGIIRDNLVARITDADWDAVIDVSLKGSFYCARAVSPSHHATEPERQSCRRA